MAESPPADDEPEDESDVSREATANGAEDTGNESPASDAPFLVNPELKLEDCRRAWGANHPEGRGSGTASGRGYNAERLASAVFEEKVSFRAYSEDSYYDSFNWTEERYYRVEVKCCVERYPSGGAGRFRIWEHNHTRILEASNDWRLDASYFLYVFIVYTVVDEIEKEVGKLIATVDQIEAVVDRVEWPLRDHTTMGEKQAKDLSWTALLDRLDVSEERFREADAVDVTTRVRE